MIEHTVNRDRALQPGYGSLCDGQSQAKPTDSAGIRSFGLKEGAEYRVEFALSNPYPRIDYADDDLSIFLQPFDVDVALQIVEVDPVQDNLVKRRAQQRPVRVKLNRRVGDVHLQPDAFVRCVGL